MKGVKMMDLKKVFFIAAVTLLVFPLIVVPAMAGGTPGPPQGLTIVGPELWGVVVVTCGEPPIRATLRIKQIDADCNVAKQAHFLDFDGDTCPVEDNVWYRQLTPVTLTDTSGNAIAGTPIFVRIKNFETESNGTISFDALIKFIQ
jgi:hypothetical protein